MSSLSRWWSSLLGRTRRPEPPQSGRAPSRHAPGPPQGTVHAPTPGQAVPTPGRSPRTDPHAAQRRPAASPPDGEEPSPGQCGADATVEVDPTTIGPVRMTYNPSTDGDPDPGEIVWTWVPFEENDGRGKDRPVLVVAAEPSGTVLAVQLTSKEHDGERDFVPIGAGAWDGEHRPSWVNIDRVIRVHPTGMRREAAALARDEYERVGVALRARYGWR